MQKANIQLETLTCPSCLQKIEGAVKELNGIDKDSLKVMFNASRVKVEFNENEISIEEIEKAITDMGYEVKKSRVRAAYTPSHQSLFIVSRVEKESETDEPNNFTTGNLNLCLLYEDHDTNNEQVKGC